MNARYRKFLVASLGAVIIVANEVFGAAIGLEEIREVINGGTALLTAVGVRQIPNSGV